MDDEGRAPMEVPERVGDVLEHPSDLGDVERLLAQTEAGEALALDLLHHEVERAVLLEVLDVLRQARVIERRERPRLALGELDVLPGLRLVHTEALDRDHAARVGRRPGSCAGDVAVEVIDERFRSRTRPRRMGAVVPCLVRLTLRAFPEPAQERVAPVLELPLVLVGRRRRG